VSTDPNRPHTINAFEVQRRVMRVSLEAVESSCLQAYVQIRGVRDSVARIGTTPDGSQRFTATSVKIPPGFIKRRIQAATPHILFDLIVPDLRVELFKPRRQFHHLCPR
jgi:hypothetical protein